MASLTIPVGVIVERRPAATRWADHSWRAAGVLIEPPVIETGTVLKDENGVVSFYAGTADLDAHSVETGNYRDNLATGQPKVWVVLKPSDDEPGIAVVAVTPDPAEGEAMTEAGDLIVEAVPMPSEIARRLAAFVEQHHVEHTFVKRVRD